MEEVLCVANRIICLLRCYKTRFIIQQSCKKGQQNKLFSLFSIILKKEGMKKDDIIRNC